MNNMNNYEILGLYDHNIRSYEKVKQQFKKDKKLYRRRYSIY